VGGVAGAFARQGGTLDRGMGGMVRVAPLTGYDPMIRVASSRSRIACSPFPISPTRSVTDVTKRRNERDGADRVPPCRARETDEAPIRRFLLPSPDQQVSETKGKSTIRHRGLRQSGACLTRGIRLRASWKGSAEPASRPCIRAMPDPPREAALVGLRRCRDRVNPGP
jgi:hypothetical protein